MRVELSRKAVADLRKIQGFIQAESSAAARTWFAGLRDEIFSLETLPDRGSLLLAKPKYRQILYGRKPDVYAVVYTVRRKAGIVVIAEVRHGARRAIR